VRQASRPIKEAHVLNQDNDGKGTPPSRDRKKRNRPLFRRADIIVFPTTWSVSCLVPVAKRSITSLDAAMTRDKEFLAAQKNAKTNEPTQHDHFQSRPARPRDAAYGDLPEAPSTAREGKRRASRRCADHEFFLSRSTRFFFPPHATGKGVDRSKLDAERAGRVRDVDEAETRRFSIPPNPPANALLSLSNPDVFESVSRRRLPRDLRHDRRNLTRFKPSSQQLLERTDASKRSSSAPPTYAAEIEILRWRRRSDRASRSRWSSPP